MPRWPNAAHALLLLAAACGSAGCAAAVLHRARQLGLEPATLLFPVASVFLAAFTLAAVSTFAARWRRTPFVVGLALAIPAWLLPVIAAWLHASATFGLSARLLLP